MVSTFFFLIGTLLLSLNLVRPFGFAVSDWFYFISMGLAIFETILADKKNRSVWFGNPFIWCALLILIGGVLSLINSRDYGTAFEEIIQQLYAITLFISMAWIMVNRGQLRKVILVFIISGIFAASVAAIDYLAGTRIGPFLSNTPNIRLWGRYAGPLAHPNKFGYFLVITSMLSLAQIREVKRWGGRAIWMLFFLLQVFGIYLSGSVTAFVGFILALLVFSFASIKKRVALINVFYALTTLIIVLVMIGMLSGNKMVLNIVQSAADHIDSSLNRVETITGSSRLVVYKQALDAIAKSPIIGQGFDQITTSRNSSLILDIHNVFIQIWFVGGLFSFLGLVIIYIWMGFLAIKTLLTNHDLAHPVLLTALASIVLAIILMDQFQDAMYQREKWLAFGLFATYFWTAKRHTNNSIPIGIKQGQQVKE